MVRALHEAHRVLRPRGILVDARPDSRVPAYAERVRERGFDIAGSVATSGIELANDRHSDRAIARVVAEGLFRPLRRGRFWHRVPLADLAALTAYVAEHPRFQHHVRWSVDPATRRRWRDDRWVIRRAVRYEVFAAV